MKNKTQTVGIIVGRFQAPYLHDAHKKLISTVVADHEKVIIFLGLSPLKTTQNNPLDFQMREQMIKTTYPDVIIQYIKDVRDDELWSKNLDRQILDLIGPNQDVVLYGSRDSFIPHYKGKFRTTELESEVILSATEIRQKAYAKAKNSEDFRSGVIWATGNVYPTTYTTVDIAIFNEDETELLLGKKPGEKQFRFIGGFSEPDSPNFETDARREVVEETKLEITDPVYIGSFKIDDWRYRNEKNKIKTLFFKAKRMFGKAEAADDISELKWFSIDTITDLDIVPEHQPLLEALKKNLIKSIET